MEGWEKRRRVLGGLKGIFRWMQGRVVQEFEVKERPVDSSATKETPHGPGWVWELERRQRGEGGWGGAQAGGGGARGKFVHACARARTTEDRLHI